MKQLLAILVLILYPLSTMANYVWPLEIISDYSCRKDDFSDLSDNCLHDIPHLTPAMYHTHSNNTQLRQTFGVLRGGTYKADGGWDYTEGGHTGVDIITAKGTPVYAIGDGTVLLARSSTVGYGNVVKIKHRLPNGKSIYSIYAHMDSLSVTTGDPISAGKQIGTVGDTGYASTPHLHLEINTTTKYDGPWYPYVNCPEQNLSRQVNEGSCREYLIKHSIDPLALLASNNTFIQPIKNITNTPSTTTTSNPKKQTTSSQTTQKLGITSHNTAPSTTQNTITPPPSISKEPLPPKKTRYREQAIKNQEAYNNTKKIADPSGTYIAVQQILDQKLPSFDSNKLTEEAQDFIANYELVIDGPEQLIFDGARDKISLRLSWIHRVTGNSYTGDLPFTMNLITLRDKVWVKEASASDGSQLIFLTKRDSGINLILWALDTQIAYAKPLLSI